MLKRLRTYPIADTAIASVNNNAICFGFNNMLTSFLMTFSAGVNLKDSFENGVALYVIGIIGLNVANVIFWRYYEGAMIRVLLWSNFVGR